MVDCNIPFDVLTCDLSAFSSNLSINGFLSAHRTLHNTLTITSCVFATQVLYLYMILKLRVRQSIDLIFSIVGRLEKIKKYFFGMSLRTCYKLWTSVR